VVRRLPCNTTSKGQTTDRMSAAMPLELSSDASNSGGEPASKRQSVQPSRVYIVFHDRELRVTIEE
jgi:hypothetical protein